MPGLEGRNRTLLASYLGLLELHAVCKEESFLRRKKGKCFDLTIQFCALETLITPCASSKSY